MSPASIPAAGHESPIPSWDPGSYERFADHRLRAAQELIHRIDHPAPRAVYDAGCGTGSVTRLLARRWPDAAVTGIDASPEMLERAAATPSGIRWERADLRSWRPPGEADIIVANAVLHWIPDHGRLIERLAATLAPGGFLAIQMPLSWHEPSHLLMRACLDAAGPLGDATLRKRLAQPPVMTAEDYHELLRPFADRVDIWETTYLHVLTGDEPVYRWVEGAGLRPVLDALQPDELAVFVSDYRRALREAYPTDERGETLYRFPRLFVVARR